MLSGRLPAAQTKWLFAAPAVAQSIKAFPTAEGFGANAVGGRGGRVIEVTNLNDSGDGSLRSCMEASGPRICIFRVSGTITLKSAIRVSSPYLTVAGQTSPGGVQIKGTQKPEGDWGVWFVNGAHDIIVRHLRVRMGGNMKHDAGNNLLCYGTAEPGVHDVIFDHCSVCWGSDTQLDWYGSYLDRATFQWNIIAEADMGSHIGGNRAPKNITLHHNLYANLGSRTPLMQHAAVFDFRNNIIYNWNGNNSAVFGQFALNSSAFGNVVDNLWLAGPESGYPYLNVGNGGPVRIDGSAAEEGGTRLYISGNWGPRCPAGCANDWIGHGVNTWDYYELNKDGSTHLVDQAQYDAEKPFSAPPVALDPVSKLLDKVLPTVGAYKPSRDTIDQRIVKSVRDKTGTYRVNTSSPWPDLAAGAPAPPADSDHDGMPDAWEKAHGLDPNNDGDGAALAANGYTNVENYLNELAGDPIPRPKRDESNLMSVCTSPDVQDFTRKAADGPRRMIRRPGWSIFRK
jgi:pectate lyase